jgi:hypothetical protein
MKAHVVFQEVPIALASTWAMDKEETDVMGYGALHLAGTCGICEGADADASNF